MASAPNPRNYIQWKVMVISPSRTLGNELNVLLSEQLPFAPLIELKDYPARTDLAEAIPSQAPNLCFVDVTTNSDWALSIISDISAIDPKLPIVAMHSTNDPNLILRCLRMGATEFLLQPFTVEQFTAVMDRLAQQHRNGRGSGELAKVVCVIPAKGACGASTIACSLAYQWRRLGAKRILLADLDPLTGTLSFQLKLRQSYSFMDALTRAGAMDSDIWKSLVYTTQGVDVLLAPEKPVHGIDESHDPGGLIEFARMTYDLVVVDCNGAYGQWALTLGRQCDDLMLVTTNELPSLQATQRTLAYLDRNRIERSKIKIVVNRYHKDVGLSQDVIEAALHTEVYHLVPSDYETVQRALVEGRPIATTTGLGRSLAALAEKLSGKEAVAEEKPSGFSFGGLLSGLLRR
jgi:pilus assembly protein CpaE